MVSVFPQQSSQGQIVPWNFPLVSLLWLCDSTGIEGLLHTEHDFLENRTCSRYRKHDRAQSMSTSYCGRNVLVLKIAAALGSHPSYGPETRYHCHRSWLPTRCPKHRERLRLSTKYPLRSVSDSCAGPTVGQAIAEHPLIEKVAFTGSTATGRRIQEASAKSNLKAISLELGGKSPNIIFEDADLEQAVKWAARGIFPNAGMASISYSAHPGA